MRMTTSLGLCLAVAMAVLGGCSSSSKNNDGGGGAGGTAMGGSGGSAGSGGSSAGGSGGARDAGAAGSGGGGGMSAGGADGGARDAAGGSGGSGGSAGATGDGGSTTGDGGITKLTVTLASLGNATAKGTATFEKVGANVKLTVDLTGVMPTGKHGIHIHQTGSCADTMDDAGVTAGGAAGAHWNPTNAMHGTSVDTGHLGDIGNIDAMADGKAMLTLVTDKWSLGTGMTNDVANNHAIILHAMMDDGTTQPTGNSGARIACGVVK